MRLSLRVGSAADGTAGLPLLMALASITAGLIHAAVVPEHFEEEWVFGVFFVLAGGFQIVWAIAVVSRSTALVLASGALANGAMIGTWVVSRTIGLPIGPEAWMAEPVQVLDVTATWLELLIVLGSVVLVRRGVHETSLPPNPVRAEPPS